MALCLLSCSSKSKQVPEAQPTTKAKKEVVPTIYFYSMGSTDKELMTAMLDSLKAHYPQCKYMGTVPLPKDAITQKRHDHVRYRTDILNEHLAKYKTDNTIVLGVTKSDIGKDNFRGQPHWGIFGEANGIGKGVAVVSSYRLHSNTELFRAILHELGHTEGLRHCKNKGCLMQNANGKNPFKTNISFCKSCKDYMISKHWRL